MPKTPKPNDIAIIGMACHLPGATSIREYWENIVHKRDCITDIPETHWDTADYWDNDPRIADKSYCKRGGFLPFVDFDPMEFGIAPKDLDVIDTAQLLGMKVAKEAMLDAGYGDKKPFVRDRCAAIVGTTSITELATPLNMRLAYPTMEKILKKHGVDEAVIQSVSKQYADSFPIWQENSFPGVLGNVISGRIANTLDLGGTNCVIDAACASALGAVKMSIDALLAKTCDMVVTGGVDTVNNIFMYLCFSKTPAFSKEGKTRPFDKNSDGILIGEGLGLVVLKRYEDAIRDNDRIYSVIRSIGSSSDGKAKSIYQPLSSGQQKALLQAYEMAGVHPRSIELLEAHGTGTPVGDLAEVTALKSVYSADSPDTQWCALGSVKSQIGHTKASAGIAGLMKAALALYHKVLPPTINIEEPNPKMELESSSFYINSEIRPWVRGASATPRRAACSAFGFGGTNFHVVLEEHEDTCRDSLYQPGPAELFVFQAEDAPGLSITLQKVLDQLPMIGDFHQFARHNQHLFLEDKPATLVIVSKNVEELKAILAESRTHLLNKPEEAIQGKSAFYFPKNHSIRRQKLALAFPGQGAQYVAMGRELLLAFPFLHEILEEQESLLREAKLPSISQFLYPVPVFSAQKKQEQEETLRRTDLAQAALAFVNVATFEVLKKLGVKFDASCGHSFGELTALYAANVFDRKTYFRLAHERGRLMLECANDSSGTMAAVLAPLKEIEDKLKLANQALKTEVTLANYNAPEQGVISGKTSEVEKVSAWLKENNLTVKPIAVSAAFHTSLMAAAVKKFGDFVKQCTFGKAAFPVYSNMTGSQYGDSAEVQMATLRDQLLYPVKFTDLVSNMVKDGTGIFVEAGPSKILTGLIQRIAPQDAVVSAVDSMSRGEPNLGNFLTVVARLIASGHVKFNASVFGLKPETLALKSKRSPVTIRLNGANYLKKETKEAVHREPLVKQKIQAAALPVPEVVTPPPVAISQATRTIPEVKNTIVKPQGIVKSAVVKTAVATPVKHTGKNMNQDNQFSQNLPSANSLEELQRYRLRMVEVQEQFLQMQMEANRLMERMLSGGTFVQEYTPPARTQTIAPPVAAPVAALSVPTPPAIPAPMPVMQAPVQPKSGSVLGDMFEKRPAQPAKAVAKPVKVAEAVAPSTSVAHEIQNYLMQTIAEKTGFPMDMLSADMDLENDLAVDSIRRVEILGAVQEKFPAAPTIGPAQLGVLKTIADIVGYLSAGAPVSAVAAAKPVQKTATASGSDSSAILNFLMSTISEKTGFPMDMLSSDMDLENDLAVDSIRRVEILGAVQEKFPAAPTIGPAQLGTLKTISDIVGYLGGQSASAAASTTASTSSSSSESNAMTQTLLQIISEKTGFPTDMLSPEMDLENDLAVDSIRRVEILGAMQEKYPHAPSIGPAQLGSIRTIGDVISYLSGNNGALASVGEEKKKI